MPLHALADLSNISGTWKAKTANYTAKAFDQILCDTTGGAFTITLPASPVLGSDVLIRDSAASFAAHNLTVARNGKTIRGAAADSTLATNNQQVRFVYSGTTWTF